VVALDYCVGMTVVCVGVVIQMCSLGVITPLTVVGWHTKNILPRTIISLLYLIL